MRKNKGHGWTFLPTINDETSLRNSYDFRRVLEPSGILLTTFRKQRNNERTEIARARKAAEACAEQYP